MKHKGALLAKVCILSAFGIAFLFLLLPSLFNSLVAPQLFSNARIPLSLTITSLTPWSLTGYINLGNQTSPALDLPKIVLRYSPGGLINREIDSIAIDGATIRLAVEDGKLSLVGIKGPHSKNETPKQDLPLPLLPVRLNKFTLNNGHVLISGPGLPELSLTLKTTLTPTYTLNSPTSFMLDGFGVEAQTSGSVNLSAKAELRVEAEKSTLHLDCNLPKLEQLNTILPLPPSSSIKGMGSLTGIMHFTRDLDSLHHFSVQLAMPYTLSISPDLYLNNTDPPLIIQLEGSPNLAKYTIANLKIAQPFMMTSDLQGTYNIETSTLSGAGRSTVEFLEDDLTFRYQGTLEGGSSRLILNASGKSMRFRSLPLQVELGPYDLQTEVLTEHGTTSVHKHLKVDTVDIEHHDLRLNNINGAFSYSTSADSLSTQPGHISVGSVIFRGEDLLELNSSLNYTSEGYSFSGTVKGHQPSPLQFHFSGKTATAEPFDLSFSLEPQKITTYTLPNLVPLPPDLDFSATVEAEGAFRISAEGPDGNIRIGLHDGEVSNTEKNLFLSGIAGELNFPSLPEVISSPSQELRIDSIALGSIKLNNGSITYRIEDPDTVFIEKSSFGWCNGRVESGSLRITPAAPSISTTLYCDRLQFSELLNQFGISDTEGDGSLNGRLPLHFQGKEIVFDDGFLFSTPGNSGIVRFNNTAMLRQGMPEMGKAAYLEYSLQALENFSYNWTKLTFNSEGEDLLVTMQIDGKPQSPLPFGYRSGQLIRDTKGTGIQHPIRLDVNFHLPFVQMFRYGQGLQQLMENMK